MELIRFENVSFSYGSKKILDNINFSINEGDYIYILGENGSGKTTLLNGLLSLKKPNSGKIIYKDQLSKGQIGYIPQKKDIKENFPASVWEIVLSGRIGNKIKLKYSNLDKEIARKNLELLNMYNMKDLSFKELSGGQKQRVLLARALCATEKLLVLDEPDTGLDVESKKDLYKIINILNKEYKIAIVMVTHDISNNLKDGSHIINVKNKKVEYFKIDNNKEYNISDLLKGSEEND